MILLKNKKTGMEYYVDDVEFDNLRKNNLLRLYQVMGKKDVGKAPITVEVTEFLKKKKAEQPQEVQSVEKIEPNPPEDIEKPKKYTPIKHQNQQ